MNNSFCTITCRCGHAADMDIFTRTPILGDLPRGHYQCRFAWTVDNGERDAKWRDGMVYLPKSRIVELEAAL